MGRKVEYTRVIVEHFLRAIPMMHIIVNDHYPFKSVAVDGVACSHCYIVKEAEAHGCFGQSMMTGRAHQAVSVVNFAVHNRI